MGNPAAWLLVPAVTLATPCGRWGRGATPRFMVSSGGVRARAVRFGCAGGSPSSPARPSTRPSALERNFWNGAVEPRLVLRHARPCAPDAIALLGEPDDYLGAALDAPDLDPCRHGPLPARYALTAAATARSVLATRSGRRRVYADEGGVLGRWRRARGRRGMLGDGGGVLGVRSDSPRRLSGLSARSEGLR